MTKYLFSLSLLFFSLNSFAENFKGIVHVNGCSGSLVRTSLSKDSDQALILSVGHCVPFPLEYYQYAYHYAYQSTVTFLTETGVNSSFTAQTKEIIYATMTGTDVALYALSETYQQIEKRTGVKALTLSTQAAVTGKAITILSGQLHKAYHCSIAAITPYLVQGEYIWKDSLRYSSNGCAMVGGTSGSPVIDDVSGLVVGVNNTGNEGNGRACSFIAPCEVDQLGNISNIIPAFYAQQVYQIAACFNSQRKFDVQTVGCALFH